MGRGKIGVGVAACSLAVLLSAGCGSSASSTQSQPSPRPAEVQVTLSSVGARAHPRAVEVGKDGTPLHGSGGEIEVLFVIHNELDHTSLLEVHGGIEISDDHNSEPIPAHSNGTLQVPLHAGIHQLNGDEIPNQTNGQLFIVPSRP